jgi:hypothetical protein
VLTLSQLLELASRGPKGFPKHSKSIV